MDKGYVLVVDVIAGQNLVACDDNGKSDPYVVVQAGKQKFKTRILKETLDPVWAVGANSKAESFTFTNKQVGKATELLVKCFDWDRFDSDDRMGQFIIPFKDLADNKIHDEWWKLEPQRRGDKVSGSLHLKVQIRKAVKKSGKHSALWSAVKTTNFVGVNDALRKGSIDWAETGDEDCSLLHLALSPSELNTDAEGILMKLLQSDGSQIGLRDAYGNTPLHDFCKKWKSPSCKDAFDLFIKKGADVNAQNSAGETPLHLVVFNPSLKVLLAELLLSKGAKINQANKEGDTCIHYSMSGGRQDLIKLWVLHKGDFTLIGANKKSALEMVPSPTVASTIRDSEEIVRWLQKIGFERYTANFLEEEIFLFLLCEMEEKALAGFIDSRDDREAIISKAKLWRDAKESGKVMRREETFRRQQDHLKRKNEERQKEEVLRKTLKESVQSKPETAGKAEWWEIDISDLDFTRRLGDGAAGEVFKGHWRGKPVAIKVLKATNEEAVVLEFIREFWIMVNVKSPHLVEFYGATLKEKLTMVMELCERGSLYGVLREPATTCPISWEIGISMLDDIAQGISVLHNHNPVIVHRDLKTLNVLVTKNHRCKVADFGLSRFQVPDNTPTLKRCRGTYAYIAPEVFRNEGYQLSSDVYSYSIIIWEIIARLLGGQYEKPYSEFKHLKLDVQVLVQAAKLGKRPTVRDSTPQPVHGLITECWDVDKEKRPTIAQVIERLVLIKKKYLAAKEEWDAVLGTPPPQ